MVAAWPQPRSKVSKITGASLGGRAAAVLHASARAMQVQCAGRRRRAGIGGWAFERAGARRRGCGSAGGRSSRSGWRRECSTGAPSGRAGWESAHRHGGWRDGSRNGSSTRRRRRSRHLGGARSEVSITAEAVGRAGALKKPQEVVAGLESAHRHGGWPSRVKNSSSRRRWCRSGRCLAASRSKVSKITGASLGGRAAAVLHASARCRFSVPGAAGERESEGGRLSERARDAADAGPRAGALPGAAGGGSAARGHRAGGRVGKARTGTAAGATAPETAPARGGGAGAGIWAGRDPRSVLLRKRAGGRAEEAARSCAVQHWKSTCGRGAMVYRRIRWRTSSFRLPSRSLNGGGPVHTEIHESGSGCVAGLEVVSPVRTMGT